MQLIKLKDLEKKDFYRVNYFIKKGRLNKYVIDGYVAYDKEEFDNIIFEKRGRPIKEK